MRTLVMIILLCVGCTAPLDSAKHFARPKYELSHRTKPTPGKPSVRQTWWKSLWFWQRKTTKYKPQERP